jgi:hypothetical protein
MKTVYLIIALYNHDLFWKRGFACLEIRHNHQTVQNYCIVSFSFSKELVLDVTFLVKWHFGVKSR